MLKNKGVNMRAKDFAVGLRIEHLQKNIGFSQYGKKYPLLPAAEAGFARRGEGMLFILHVSRRIRNARRKRSKFACHQRYE